MMAESRLDELNATARNTSVSKGYTRFVKWMRFVLPLIALGLTAIVVTWPEMDDKITIIPKKDIIPSSGSALGQTELLNPSFETTDEYQQPVHVTAKRALQNQENPDLVRLEKPLADLKMEDGTDVHIEALEGTYEQETEKLFLQQEVKIRHESGYELRAEELRVDMQTKEAFSDKNVEVEGPEAKVEATGLEGNVGEGLLIFKGPAKLTLTPKEKTKTGIINIDSKNE